MVQPTVCKNLALLFVEARVLCARLQTQRLNLHRALTEVIFD